MKEQCEHGVLWSMECLSCPPQEYAAATPPETPVVAREGIRAAAEAVGEYLQAPPSMWDTIERLITQRLGNPVVAATRATEELLRENFLLSDVTAEEFNKITAIITRYLVADVEIKARYEKAHDARYVMAHAVHPDIVVLWFLALKSHWFDDPDNLFYRQRERAKAYLYKWVETGELAPSNTTLEITTEMKFREWLESSWGIAATPLPETPVGGEALYPECPNGTCGKCARCVAASVVSDGDDEGEKS